MKFGISEGSGCSAARLARHVRDVEAGSSNLPIPTTKIPGNIVAGDFYFPRDGKLAFKHGENRNTGEAKPHRDFGCTHPPEISEANLPGKKSKLQNPNSKKIPSFKLQRVFIENLFSVPGK